MEDLTDAVDWAERLAEQGDFLVKHAKEHPRPPIPNCHVCYEAPSLCGCPAGPDFGDGPIGRWWDAN